MTTVAVLADPPVEGHTLAKLTPAPLSEAEAVELYRAMLADICETIQRGEADLLVNYRPDDQMPADVDSETRLRECLTEELDEELRFEPQVGESYAGRIGNSLTHLLDAEAEGLVGAVEPTAAFLRREHIGNIVMKLRTSDVVLGPAPGGQVYFAGFTDPIDFDDAYAPPAIETLVGRAREADLEVDFLPMTPLAAEDFATAVALLRARLDADRLVPPRTAARIDQWGLAVDRDGTVTREA